MAFALILFENYLLIMHDDITRQAIRSFPKRSQNNPKTFGHDLLNTLQKVLSRVHGLGNRFCVITAFENFFYKKHKNKKHRAYLLETLKKHLGH